MRLLATLLTCLLTFPLVASRAQAQGFVVIVNPGTGVSSVPAEQLAKLFLKKQGTWPDGSRVAPVDQAKGSETRQRFTSVVHKRTVAAVDNYWKQEIFSGRSMPPVEKRSDSDVIAFVRSTPGAIGYVSASATLGDGVKVVTVVGL